MAHKKRPFIVDSFVCEANRAKKQGRERAIAKAKKDGDWTEDWEVGRVFYVRPYDEEVARGD